MGRQFFYNEITDPVCAGLVKILNFTVDMKISGKRRWCCRVCGISPLMPNESMPCVAGTQNSQSSQKTAEQIIPNTNSPLPSSPVLEAALPRRLPTEFDQKRRISCSNILFLPLNAKESHINVRILASQTIQWCSKHITQPLFVL